MRLRGKNGYYSGIRERRQEYNKKYVPRIVILVPEIISVFYSDTVDRTRMRRTSRRPRDDRHHRLRQEKAARAVRGIRVDDETDGIVVLNQYYQG